MFPSPCAILPQSGAYFPSSTAEVLKDAACTKTQLRMHSRESLLPPSHHSTDEHLASYRKSLGEKNFTPFSYCFCNTASTQGCAQDSPIQSEQAASTAWAAQRERRANARHPLDPQTCTQSLLTRTRFSNALDYPRSRFEVEILLKICFLVLVVPKKRKAAACIPHHLQKLGRKPLSKYETEFGSPYTRARTHTHTHISTLARTHI